MTLEQFQSQVNDLRPKNIDGHCESTVNQFFTTINGKGVYITQEYCISFVSFNDLEDTFVCIEKSADTAISKFKNYLIRKNFV